MRVKTYVCFFRKVEIRTSFLVAHGSQFNCFTVGQPMLRVPLTQIARAVENRQPIFLQGNPPNLPLATKAPDRATLEETKN